MRRRTRYTRFRPRIRSRHPSHDVLRAVNKTLPLFPFKSVIRFGSTTEMRDTVTNGGNRIEINTIEAIRNTSSKLLMKERFTSKEVKTAKWAVIRENPRVRLLTWARFSLVYDEDMHVEAYRFCEYDGGLFEECPLNFPVVSKSIYGSRGTGNVKHNSPEELEAWAEGKDLTRYIFEEFKNFVREYRLHITKDGCFYACRKMLRRDTPEEARWYRNDDHCVWILEENESFDKPSNWEDIVEHSVRALKAVGLDVGAVDVKVQSATNRDGEIREEPSFIIIEINSAPSFGSVTEQKYIEELPKILIRKNKQHNE